MRVLIFGTCYVDTAEKCRLLEQWIGVNRFVNRMCDRVLVDSASPWLTNNELHGEIQIMQFGDNVGHLARGGRDGWGRAFCYGLRLSIEHNYDYVVHVEGDSLCRLDVAKICEQMSDSGGLAWSVPVRGTRRVESGWVETGLMFLDTEFIEESNLIERYDWQDGASKRYPHTPEAVLHDLLGDELEMQNWMTVRDDLKLLNEDTVPRFDWISHATPQMFDRFYAHNVRMSA